MVSERLGVVVLYVVVVSVGLDVVVISVVVGSVGLEVVIYVCGCFFSGT